MKIVGVCALWLIFEASASRLTKPGDPHDDIKTSGDLHNEVNDDVNISGDLHNEVNSLLDSAKYAFSHAQELRHKTRLRGKHDSKQVTMNVSDEELALKMVADEELAYQAHFQDMIEKLKKIAATSAHFEAKLKLTQRDLEEAQAEKSTLTAQLRSSIAREQSAHHRFQELQAMYQAEEGRISAEEGQISEQTKSIQQLKLTVNETSRALNASHANEEHMSLSMKQNAQEYQSKQASCSQTVSKLTNEVQGLRIQLKGALANSTSLHSELVADREAAYRKGAEYRSCAKDLEATKKERDSALGSFADETAAHTQLVVEHTKIQEEMRQMKAAYEKKIAQLKAESENDWFR
eukprot:gnl/TRDRNA2_/TRDRNA2_59963_c0_seq1.p1 gnl/TRDRNA2_/TRDRNA2_59963_c0~~gnl/TRDRNA2_/TRDRNA2_59963_c0_seq1.p1  ORF type:complete len:350 (+),score=69.92 gnl/TRDRNA2_/TRDRNA2_59963_c0_seq1:107-1156(+)